MRNNHFFSFANAPSMHCKCHRHVYNAFMAHLRCVSIKVNGDNCQVSTPAELCGQHYFCPVVKWGNTDVAVCTVHVHLFPILPGNRQVVIPWFSHHFKTHVWKSPVKHSCISIDCRNADYALVGFHFILTLLIIPNLLNEINWVNLYKIVLEEFIIS